MAWLTRVHWFLCLIVEGPFNVERFLLVSIFFTAVPTQTIGRDSGDCQLLL
ncbi:unnamed protein product [Ectocarpus sp. CCAP 1310/34]|nr:unnamed protein product [Ectocarpus sp. CCAP 1310/34]